MRGTGRQEVHLQGVSGRAYTAGYIPPRAYTAGYTHTGSLLGSSWCTRVASWDPPGVLRGSLLGPSWCTSGCPLGTSWCTSGCPLGTSWVSLGTSWVSSWVSPGYLLGVFRTLLGTSWVSLGPSWVPLGVPPAGPWVPLGVPPAGPWVYLRGPSCWSLGVPPWSLLLVLSLVWRTGHNEAKSPHPG